MTAWGYAVMAAVCVLALSAMGWQRRRTRRTLETMNRMLDTAMQGDFSEDSFDETLLSALESKLAHDLAASTTSARQVAAEKEKLKSLIGDISHQTKTPMANILLYTQLLMKQPGSAACLHALDAQIRKLNRLIDALVKTSRLESGVIALHPVPGRLHALLESAAAQLMPKAIAKGISITVEAADADAVFDPKWTQEAILNLVDNAVKYTAPGGEVVLSAAAYPMFSVVHVRDNGPGIAEEEQPKVFQRFYRGMAHRSEEGVGIGLYLVRSIAEGQGGYVKVSSQPGKGSTFSLYLPGR